MTPQQAIAMLDNQLSQHGQPVVVRRGNPSTTLPTTGFVRGYKPSEIVGLLKQGDSNIVLSPTGLTGDFATTIPNDTDRIDIAGQTKKIVSVESIRIGTTMVRLNLLVRGE
jgi:hypothetical protein